MKVAFYAPMKSPEHPTPSGDRRMARLFMQAIEGAGYDVELASSFRSFDKIGEAAFQEKIHVLAVAEAERLIAKYQAVAAKDRPVLWFSYHLYHKAPDWIGPRVTRALNIPYFVAEASHAPKQKDGRWASGYDAAAKVISEAERVFHMTRLDGECLASVVQNPEKLVYLPPFIEDRSAQTRKPSGPPVTLLCVAMMRPGDKFQSYSQLADALGELNRDDWQLVIAGDGEKKTDVEALFSKFGDKITYLGAVGEAELAKAYGAADIYVWPACGEAFGMAFLEAARAGLVVVGGDLRGVPDVVIDGRTGLLAPADHMKAFARCIRQLIEDPEMRAKMGAEGRRFVAEDRSLNATSLILKAHMEEVLS